MKDKKVLLILVCTAVLVLMSVVFAAFSTNLTINGTGTISSTWKVEMDTDSANTKCTVTSQDTSKPTTCSVTSLTTTSLTAGIDWASPGDVVTITARVKNLGTLDANATMSATMAATSGGGACANTTVTANYTQYVAAGTATNGTSKTVTNTAVSVGPVKILNKNTTSTYNYGIYTVTITYNKTATSQAGACTFTGNIVATQAA